MVLSHKTYHRLMHTFLATTITAALFFIAAGIWIVTGPRSISFLNPYISENVKHIFPGFTTLIEDTVIAWDEQKNTLDLRVTGMRTLNKQNVHIAAFPQVSLDLPILSLIRANFTPKSLTIINPVLQIPYLKYTEDIPLLKHIEATYKNFAINLFQFLKNQSDNTPLKQINIRHANILFPVSQEEQILLQINNANIKIENQKQYVKRIIYAVAST